MDSTLLSRVNAYDSAFGTVLTSRESYLHANKNPGQTNEEYTAGINAVATAYLLWWENSNRAAIANAYINTLAGYLTAYYSLPSLPDLLDIDCTPMALMDQANYIGQFKAAVHSSYRDPSGAGGVLLTAWADDLETQIGLEVAELARFANALQAKTNALLTMQNFDDVEFNEEYMREQVRDRIYVTMGWTAFLKGPSGLHDAGIYAHPPEPDFTLTILPPLPIVETPADGFAIQYITPGITPFFIRGALLDTTFSASGAGNTVSWGAGTAHFMTETNQYFSKAFTAGSFVYTGSTVYIAYNFLQNDLVVSTNPLTAYQSNQHVVAIYYGGYNLLVNGARQSIRGSDIILNSMTPDRLANGELNADITIGNVLISGSRDRIQIGSDADPLMFIGSHTDNGFEHDPGFYFRTEAGLVLFDSITGLGANTVGSTNIRPGAVKEYHLDFGYRTIQEEGIVVSVDAMNDTVFWSSGIVTWVDELGNTINTSVLAGQAEYDGEPIYVLWEPGDDHFTTTTNPADANAEGVYVFLQYSGGSDVFRNFNSTIIDGSRIRTNSLDVNRLLANSVLTQNLYLGSDRFSLDGTERRMLIKDDEDVTRVYIGREDDEFVFKLFDKDGNLMILSGATDSYGRVDTALGMIGGSIDTINDTLTEVNQDIQDLNDLYSSIGDISTENFSAALIELQLFRGFTHIGALGDLVIEANADSVPGKVRVTGTSFDHPAIGEIQPTLPVSFQTPWINHLTPPGKWFIVVYSHTAVLGRFGAGYGSGNFFPASYDTNTQQWKTYKNGVLVGQVFTPAADDLVCAVMSKTDALAGIDQVNSYIRETQVINSRFSELYAVVGDPSDPEDEAGSIFARISNLDLVIANNEEATATSILNLTSQFEDAEADIVQLFDTTADTDEALSAYTLVVNARFDSNEADISENVIAISTVDDALAAAITTYNARFDSNEDDIADVVSNLSLNYLTTANTNSAISSAQMTLRSEMAGVVPSLLRNSLFSYYPTTPGAPESWSSWGSPTSITRSTGKYSDYSVQIAGAAGQNGGILQTISGATSGKYIIQLTTELVSGSYIGSGVLVIRNSDSAVVASYHFADIEDTNGDASSSKTGARHFRPIEIDYVATDGALNVYLLAHHSTLGSTASANSIRFHQASLMPANTEITLISGIVADIEENYYTKTQTDGVVTSAVAAAVLDLTSYIDGEAGDIAADLSLNYYTKTQTDGVVNTAISSYNISIRAYIDGEVNGVVNDLNDAIGDIEDLGSTLTEDYSTTVEVSADIAFAVSEAVTSLNSYIDGEVGDLASDLSTNYYTKTTVDSNIASSVASARTTLRSEITGSGRSLLRNANFSVYTTTPGAPERWTAWSSPTLTRVAGRFSDNALRSTTAGGVDGGVVQTITGIKSGKHFVEFSTAIASGNYTGSGVYVQRTSDGATIAYYQIASLADTNGDTSVSKTGLRHFRPPPFDYTETDGSVNVYLMSHWTAFGSTASANAIDFHLVSMEPLTAGQKSALDIAADLSINYYTKTIVDGNISSAIAASELDLTAYIDGEVGDVASDLSLNYYTKTTVDDEIETAIAAAELALTAYIDGEVGDVASDLSLNYYTKTTVDDEITTAIAAATLDLTSYIDGEVGDVTANLSLNYYTKTQVYTQGETATYVSGAIAGFDLTANSSFGDLASEVSVTGSALSTLEDSAAVFNVLVAAGGGSPAIVELLAGLGGSSIRLAADKLSLVNTGTGGTTVTALEAVNGIVKILNKLTLGSAAQIELNPSDGTIIINGSTAKIILGKQFGTGSNLALWVGPVGTAIGDATTANARFCIDDNGDVTMRSATSGARTVLSGGTFEAYDASNVRRVRLGVWS